MSYHRTLSLVRRGGRTYGPHALGPRGSLGDLIDDAKAQLSKNSQAVSLLQACSPVAQAAQTQLEVEQAAFLATWKNRDDFYHVDEMQNVITQAYSVIQHGQNLLDAFVDAGVFSSTPQNALFDAGQTGQQYVNAMNQAKQAGAQVVDAPGLKGWVIDVWSAAGEVVYLVALTKCVTPAGVAILEAAAGAGQLFTAALDLFVKAVKAVAVVAFDAATIVYHAATGALDLLKYAKYAAIGYGLFWLITEGRRRLGK